MPVRIWTHHCVVHGDQRNDFKALCLDCGERAEFSYWRATFSETCTRVMSLGTDGKAPARLVIDFCQTCSGQGYIGTVESFAPCHDCDGFGGRRNNSGSIAGELHPRALKSAPGSNPRGRWLTLTSGGTRAMESAPLLIWYQARDHLCEAS